MHIKVVLSELDDFCAFWQTTLDDLGQIYSWDYIGRLIQCMSLLYNLWFAPAGYFCLFHVCELIWSARQLKHFREKRNSVNPQWLYAACCSIFINWVAHLCFLIKCFVLPCLNFHTCNICLELSATATIIFKKHSWSLVPISMIFLFREVFLCAPITYFIRAVYLRKTILREVEKLSVKS